MKLKMKALTAACAIALGGAALPAAAAPLTGPFDTPDLVVYLSGASAPDEFLQSVATGLFNGTQGTNWFLYFDNAGGTSYRAFFGETKNTLTDASLRNKKVLIIKRSKGGSAFGVNPVARAEAIQTLKISSTTCAAGSGGSAGDYLCSIVGNDPGVAPLTGDEQVPDFGASDVNPNLFKAPFNVEFGATDLSTSEASKLTVTGYNALMMGHAVTDAVALSLGTQGVSRTEYGSMLNGVLRDWSQVGAGTIAPAGGTQVVVCRRWPGSGTQATYNWFYANFPCTTGSLAGNGNSTPARMADSDGYQVSGTGTAGSPYIIDVTAGYTVIENSGSGDVRNCLKAAQAHTDYTFTSEDGKTYKANFSAAGAALGAIGVLSMDSMGRESGWRFINLDGNGYDTSVGEGSGLGTYTPSAGTGIPGTQASLIDGKWEIAAEATLQYRNATVNGVPALGGDKLLLVKEIIKRVGDPTFQKPWTAALPPAYSPPTANVAKATRGGNQCSPLIKYF